MKILVISDSHLSPISISETYDYIIHCGDYGNSLPVLQQQNILYVKGNCDHFGPDFLDLELFSKKIFVTHGHLENVKYTLNSIYYRALEHDAKVCFFGHTHVQSFFIEGDILFLNPGSYPNSFIEILDEKIILHNKGKIKIISYRW